MKKELQQIKSDLLKYNSELQRLINERAATLKRIDALIGAKASESAATPFNRQNINDDNLGALLKIIFNSLAAYQSKEADILERYVGDSVLHRQIKLDGCITKTYILKNISSRKRIQNLGSGKDVVNYLIDILIQLDILKDVDGGIYNYTGITYKIDMDCSQLIEHIGNIVIHIKTMEKEAAYEKNSESSDTCGQYKIRNYNENLEIKEIVSFHLENIEPYNDNDDVIDYDFNLPFDNLEIGYGIEIPIEDKKLLDIANEEIVYSNENYSKREFKSFVDDSKTCKHYVRIF